MGDLIQGTAPVNNSPTVTLSVKAPWGPFELGIELVEQRCRLRCVAGLVAAYRGSTDPLIDALRAAEIDQEVLHQAALLFDRLPTRTQRNIVATFGSVNYRRRAP